MKEMLPLIFGSMTAAGGLLVAVTGRRSVYVTEMGGLVDELREQNRLDRKRFEEHVADMKARHLEDLAEKDEQLALCRHGRGQCEEEKAVLREDNQVLLAKLAEGGHP